MIAEQKPLDRERAYAQLVDLMLTGAIAESTPLSERGLAEALGVGRTPIREAIRDLVREGVLETHPTRGTFLRPLTLDDLQELYEIRFAIEGLAAFLAAERGPTDELASYGGRFDAALAAPDTVDLAAVHDEGVGFHFEIFRCAGNKRLLEMYKPFRLRFRIPFGIVRRRSSERILQSVREHRDILDAILARDSHRARELISEHLRRGLEFRMSLVSNASRHALAHSGDNTPDMRPDRNLNQRTGR